MYNIYIILIIKAENSLLNNKEECKWWDFERLSTIMIMLTITTITATNKEKKIMKRINWTKT